MLVGMICAMLLWGSLVLRVRKYRSQTKNSPVSLAIQELLTVAGGIYLSLVALNSFLRLRMPERICWQGVELDPLAAAAVLLSLIQPVILKLWERVKSYAAK